MAGGMNKRGSWGPMTDRLAQSRGEAAATPELPLKHCWVTGADGRVPGLLLEWRAVEEGGWMGRVVRPVLEQGEWVVVEQWIAGELLERA